MDRVDFSIKHADAFVFRYYVELRKEAQTDSMRAYIKALEQVRLLRRAGMHAALSTAHRYATGACWDALSEENKSAALEASDRAYEYLRKYYEV